MKTLLKKFSARLPRSWQQELKRRHFARQIRQGVFVTDEVEYGILHTLIKPGDCALDVGANVGHYSLRLSEIVGADGRVIAFEPIPATFELLSANCARSKIANITLLNAAVSATQGIVGMDVPTFANSGLGNYYGAHVTADGAVKVMTLSVDGLRLSTPVRLVKIDAEGHEIFVLRGMSELLARDHPTLIVEGDDPHVEQFLTALGYSFKTLPGSWNRVFSV